MLHSRASVNEGKAALRGATGRPGTITLPSPFEEQFINRSGDLKLQDDDARDVEAEDELFSEEF